MKMQAPAGLATFVHGGEIMTVAEDGSIEVDLETANALLSHGFTDCPEQKTVSMDEQDVGEVVSMDEQDVGSVDIESMTRVELFEFLKAAGVKTRVPITNKELKAMAREVRNEGVDPDEGQAAE